MTRKAAELDYCALRPSLNPAFFEGEGTQKGSMGQERAIKALEFGLRVKEAGYNIYLAGPAGTGKLTYARTKALVLAQEEPTPWDWCYVYNFENPKTPKALRFAPGIGHQFKEDMTELMTSLQEEMQRVFTSETYEKEKTAVVKSFDDEKDNLMKEMTEMAKAHGFTLRTTNTGIFFAPIVEGETINEERYDALPEAQKEAIETASEEVQEKAAAIMRDMRKQEKAAKQATEDLEYKVGMLSIGQQISLVKEKYQSFPQVLPYLDALQEDVLEHIGDFVQTDEDEDEGIGALIPGLAKKAADDALLRYRVNLLVDNSKKQGAPVIVDYNPSYYRLAGEVEYDTDGSNLVTDFTRIRPGLLHKANGGYYIVQIQELLNRPLSWEVLRRALKTGELAMEGLREQVGVTITPNLEPEPIPFSAKIILVGSSYYYELLRAYDEDFAKLFKIRGDFDYEMPLTRENAGMLGNFIRSCNEAMGKDAVMAVADYAVRRAEQQNKFTTCLEDLKEIITESSVLAGLSGEQTITAASVAQAIADKTERNRMYQDKLSELLDENIMLIDTVGKRVGQINALTVLDMGDYTFGNPCRITATTYVGRAGIVNIEKESAMSGDIHTKGVQILAGYLGNTYAQTFPLALSCQICFEQSYNGIDGDSASSTELYCILSSLSGLPIRQELAVTGSINQWGEIQAIGGVTHKIEGFFDLCDRRGLTGNQGVIIPASNVKDLVLCDRVVEAVKAGKFHIYPVTHVDEGIELLMERPAGVKGKNGKYPANSVHGLAMKKLKQFYEAQVMK